VNGQPKKQTRCRAAPAIAGADSAAISLQPIRLMNGNFDAQPFTEYFCARL
jgi:hypothetical protein